MSRGEDSKGAYSLIAKDIDKDGDQDLVVASNGNDRVTLWRNDGNGNFDKTIIYENADFVLSVPQVILTETAIWTWRQRHSAMGTSIGTKILMGKAMNGRIIPSTSVYRAIMCPMLMSMGTETTTSLQVFVPKIR